MIPAEVDTDDDWEHPATGRVKATLLSSEEQNDFK